MSGVFFVLVMLAPIAALARSEAADTKLRPVMKVVRLLEDMKLELSKEADDDKEVYEELTCWCQTNEQEKTKAIETATIKIDQLKAVIPEHGAKVAELKSKRKATMDELYADQKALGEATALRMKESEAFHGEETGLLDAIKAAKDAITVLSKHHPDFAQVKAVAHQLQSAKVAQLVAFAGALREEQVNVLKTFMTDVQGADSFLGISDPSYEPQSGQVFGILKQMKEDFEASLSGAQKSELKAKEEYEMLKAAKEDEIASGQKLAAQLDADIAEFSEKGATASSELEDTEEQLALDTEFLANLKPKCEAADQEYEARLKSRNEEMSAVDDTIVYLNSDEAYEAFDKTVNTAFIQTSSVANQREAKQRQRAANVLRRAAGRTGVPMLALLAASAKLDAFEKVKAEIDKMVVELKKQQEDEVKQRDYCINELNENKRDTTAAYDQKANVEAKEADLTTTIESLTAEIDTAKKANKDMMEQMKRAGETREVENADFQQIVMDQRMTQSILGKALERMKQVYGLVQQPGAPHIQTSATKTDPGNGPARFAKKEKNAGGAKVVALIDAIIVDSKKTEDEALAGEADAQAAYEDFVKESNKSITAGLQAITDMTENKAQAEEELSMAKTDFKQVMDKLMGLDSVMQDLHGQCDYIMKNFETRQAARASEIDALGEAKAILSGAK
eukprot:gnl/TRDRNA2_/TRDRNA2_170593_c2_seq4.p1 gnl/TRDRNA2_/TRDRNA2_170593_c2~~gnl/TRDRNA2_/TRDRNA2_170593_c2_seq4.p1  ORF type:complete len:679 (-),score=232.25 gnl/TRDRNA2_/TRDRNA2_170593_c2_seq4:83-2119(-)